MRDTHDYGKVVAVHPEAHAVDILMLRTGQHLPLVQVSTTACSTRSGLADLPVPTVTDASNPYDPQQTKDCDVYAAIGYVNGQPFVSGFLYPQVSQMLFKDMNRRIHRHASDVYTTTDDSGNTEFYHPSGTFLRIGTTNTHEDLTGKDLDQKWAIARNTSSAPYVHLEVHNAGTLNATIDIDPSGNITITNAGNLMATVTGKMDFEITGTAKLHSNSTITLDAPITYVTGQLNVAALSTVHGVTSTGDVVADGKSLEHHTHPVPNIQSGGATATTSPPN